MVKPFANTKKGLLKRLFNNKLHNGVSFFGIGDSSNDVPMLNLVDVPIEIFEKMTLKTEAVDAGNLDHNQELVDCVGYAVGIW